MPLNKRNTRFFHRTLYAGQTERLRLLKRDPNLKAMIVTPHLLFTCWWSDLTKEGQQLDNDVTSNHRRTWHVPVSELRRVGVNYINPLDVFVDVEGRYWQPESTNKIDSLLFENYLDIECRRTEPRQ